MHAAAYSNGDVVNLLQNKYGQHEPTPEEVVSYNQKYYLHICIAI